MPLISNNFGNFSKSFCTYENFQYYILNTNQPGSWFSKVLCYSDWIFQKYLIWKSKKFMDNFLLHCRI